MSNKCKDIDTENRKYYFFGNINIKNIDPNKINKDEKKILLFIRYMTFKDRRHVRSINVKFYALLRLRITHNALQLPVFFSPSSPSPLSSRIIRNIRKFGAKTILQITDS